MSLSTKLAERRAEDLLATDRWRCRCGANNVMTQCGSCGRRAPSEVALSDDPYPWEPFTPAAPSAASKRMTRTALVAIGIGAVTQGAMWLLLRTHAVEPTVAIRFSLLVTLGFYGVVALLLATRARPDEEARPVWSSGNPFVGALLGLVVGAAVAGVVLALLSAINGHPASDQFITMVVSEGTTARIIVMAVIAVVCAPLIEECLFRGMVAQSLRDDNRRKALVMSAALFSLWHLRLAAFRYYFLVGLLFGALYLKRGLVSSIAAHAAFNGTILVVAVAIAHGAPHTFSGSGVSVTAPAAWEEASDASLGMLLALRGPSGSEFGVVNDPVNGRTPSPKELADVIRQRGLPVPGITADIASTEVVKLPIGEAVKVEAEVRGRKGTILVLPKPGRVWTVIAATGGSTRAARDIEGMLKTLELVVTN